MRVGIWGHTGQKSLWLDESWHGVREGEPTEVAMLDTTILAQVVLRGQRRELCDMSSMACSKPSERTCIVHGGCEPDTGAVMKWITSERATCQCHFFPATYCSLLH